MLLLTVACVYFRSSNCIKAFPDRKIPLKLLNPDTLNKRLSSAFNISESEVVEKSCKSPFYFILFTVKCPNLISIHLLAWLLFNIEDTCQESVK